MIIISQDKDKIINFNNVTKLYLNFDEGADYVSIVVCDALYEELGKYKTEERAKEVLKEIIREYRHITIGYTGMKNYNPINDIDRPVYEMPLE